MRQAVATLMETDIDTVSASTLRITTAFVLYQIIFMLAFKMTALIYR